MAGVVSPLQGVLIPLRQGAIHLKAAIHRSLHQVLMGLHQAVVILHKTCIHLHQALDILQACLSQITRQVDQDTQVVPISHIHLVVQDIHPALVILPIPPQGTQVDTRQLAMVELVIQLQLQVQVIQLVVVAIHQVDRVILHKILIHLVDTLHQVQLDMGKPLLQEVYRILLNQGVLDMRHIIQLLPLLLCMTTVQDHGLLHLQLQP